ncbi:DUF1254 domain-containing protein [Agromyces arachidis]|uniref:DUF1254 domain-containing protein n=1 Tax=Agromyces arachidis TaxID=766966 RepID=UPI0040566C39
MPFEPTGPTEVLRTTAPQAPPPVVTSEFVGDLHFENEYPTAATVEKLYDQLDFQRGCQVFLRNITASSMYSFREGLRRDLGVTSPSQLVVWEGAFDARSLLLTANSETVYGTTYLDLKADGPTVCEVAPGMLGLVNDMWMREVANIGPAGPDQGRGGRFLFVPPGFDGELPPFGFHVVHSRTYGLWFVLRGMRTPDGSSADAVERQRQTRIYPLSESASPRPTTVVDASGRDLDTIHPVDIRFFHDLAALVREEHPDAVDPETAGMLAAIGIAHGRDFEPDERMTRILSEAATVGSAMALATSYRTRLPLQRYDDRTWIEIGNTGYPYYELDGHTMLDGLSLVGWFATGSSIAMVTPPPGKGSAYMWTFHGADGEWLDGSRTYELRLPPGVPAANFWSVVVYDVWTRSMLANGQPAPSLNSFADVDADADGAVTITFGPEPPADGAANWIRTVPGKGWFTILRLYGPTQGYFDHTWKPSDITPA